MDNLLKDGFNREVKYSKWLANVVVFPKKWGKWRVCVDYTSLKTCVCPKDNFPLPHIDQIIDVSAGDGMLSFLDAYSGYHQIPMYLPDVEKTSFITPRELFCYNVMPFGLKNSEATYQRLVTKMFQPLVGKTMEVYIDDMLVKSKEWLDHITHMQQAFELLKAYGMKLNLTKCAFGVSADRFLGFMMTQRGIDANPTQLQVILESPAPSSRKGIQQLIGQLASLGRFISQFTKFLKPFFPSLRKPTGPDGMKSVIGLSPGSNSTWPSLQFWLVRTLARHFSYILAISEVVVSAALFKENNDKRQNPVFFFSKSLADAETRYSHLK